MNNLGLFFAIVAGSFAVAMGTAIIVKNILIGATIFTLLFALSVIIYYKK